MCTSTQKECGAIRDALCIQLGFKMFFQRFLIGKGRKLVFRTRFVFKCGLGFTNLF